MFTFALNRHFFWWFFLLFFRVFKLWTPNEFHVDLRHVFRRRISVRGRSGDPGAVGGTEPEPWRTAAESNRHPDDRHLHHASVRGPVQSPGRIQAIRNEGRYHAVTACTCGICWLVFRHLSRPKHTPDRFGVADLPPSSLGALKATLPPPRPLGNTVDWPCGKDRQLEMLQAMWDDPHRPRWPWTIPIGGREKEQQDHQEI